MEENNKRNVIRLGLLGDSMVGKSSIIYTLLNNQFKLDISPTKGIYYNETKVTLKNFEKIKVIIFDTGGQEISKSFSINNTKIFNGIIFVFDVSRKKSLDNISFWLNESKKIKDIFNYYLFGNKSDLPKEKWEVTTEESKKFAENMNMSYFEVSAKNNTSIKESISYIVNDVYEKLEGNTYNNYSFNKNILIDENEKSEYSGCFGKGKNSKI